MISNNSIKEDSNIKASQADSYRSIFKATSLFGGVQVYQILVGIVKSKIIAVLLGPLGVGIIGLYQSALQFIQSITSLGISSSAVRDVSEANGTHDNERIAIVVAALRKIVWVTGLCGMLVVLIFSKRLSIVSFGNDDYIVPFMILSVTLLIDQLAAGKNVILQGLRELKKLAKASAIGVTCSLLFTIPIYYLYGVRGIVPTLILNSLCLFLVAWFYSRRTVIQRIKLPFIDALKQGRVMLKMGLAMSFSNILVFGSAFVIRWYIRQESGTEYVGYYNAAFTILNTYVGMIFTAIGTDYYPRLAAINNDNHKMALVASQQGEIAALILAPMLVVCISYMPFIIRLLYSEEFLIANDYITYATIGMLFKMCSWLVSYHFIAKGDSRLFVINETLANIVFLLLNIVGFKLYGLAGMGLSYTVAYFLYLIYIVYVAHVKYKYKSTKQYKILVFTILLVLIATFIIVVLFKSNIRYWICAPIALAVGFFSFKQLDKRINIKSIIRR